MFCSVYSFSLCCSMYCLCVNVYCTTATGCQLICNWQIYHIISYHIIKNLKEYGKKRLLFSLRFCTSVGEHRGETEINFTIRVQTAGMRVYTETFAYQLSHPEAQSWQEFVVPELVAFCTKSYPRLVDSLWNQSIWPYLMDLQWWPCIKAFWSVLYI
jgi:hypothetical protein